MRIKKAINTFTLKFHKSGSKATLRWDGQDKSLESAMQYLKETGILTPDRNYINENKSKKNLGLNSITFNI
jgi:predicted RNA binding protein with dsRBD fold (UPF0201 family)